MLPNLMFNETEILAFALVLLRISAFTLSWPLFSIYSVPNHVKILFTLVLAMVIFPVIDRSGLSAQALSHEVGWLAGKEVLTGLCLGFMTRLLFFALSVGGNLIATSAGLANGQLFNPAMGTSTTTVEQFYTAIGALLFLALEGHHYFLTGLVQSFQAIPLALDGTEFAALVDRFEDSGVVLHQVVEAGIKISAPVLITVFILNLVMGIIGRAVPQVNVLLTGMSVNFMAAIVVMLMAIPALILQLDHDVIAFTESLFKFMKAM